jgi:serine/threonine-protein kinase
MSPDDPPEDPPTLQRRDAPDTLAGPTSDREVHAIAGTIERLDQTAAKDVYALGEVIGRGGGGEVLSAHDKRIGRNVALKRMRAQPTDAAVARFLREARIQARLDHPAIVPVYEMGRDPEGRPYFTMKRLAGTTLGAVLVQDSPPSRQRLLRAFADVCHAIDFAHARSIVHRDLKPANIMLGGYGEVYVLDWGVARVIEDSGVDPVMGDIDSLEPQMAETDLLGTPGYMAPEQIHSRDKVDRAADVYALAAILFEIVAGEPLHPRTSALNSTLAGEVVKSPAQRRPDRGVAPEIDALCIAALSMSPAARPTARELATRVEAFLDGDRDVARRRTLALEELWRARAAMTAGQRADAMRAAGRALALDPETQGAGELVTALMLEPPADPPLELQAAWRDTDANSVRRHAVTAIVAYLAIASFLPLAMWNGILRWGIVLGVFGVAVAMAFAAWRIRHQPERSFAAMFVYAIGNAILLGLMSRMIGPFTFVPAIACVITMSVMAYPAFIARPWALICLIIVGYMVPVALEVRGVIDATWEIRPGELISHAGALVVEGTPTIVLLVIASLATIVVAGVHAASITRASRQAQHKLVAQAWHLRQLLPTG